MKLPDSAVLVTGASTGIGEATALALAAEGARVGLVARRGELLEAVASRARDAGSPDVAVWPADLSDLDRAAEVALEAWDRFEGLDALVNNAGAPKRRHVERLPFSDVEAIMRLNFLSPVRMTLALLPLMRERGGGVVVNVASLAGRVGPPRESAYAASKFALTGFSEVMAVDLWDEPIDVRVVQPGPIDTPIWEDMPDNERATYAGPWYPPADCAAAILDALTGDGFERFVPAELGEIVAAKAQNIDDFLAGAVAFEKAGAAQRPVS